VNLCSVSAINASKKVPLSVIDYPFFLDTGATTHLSPERADFLDLRPIPPRSITGVGGTQICAIGVGTIRLSVGRGTRLVLEDVLYVPSATVCLVSVLALNRQHGFTSHFDSSRCWITNSKRAVVAQGVVAGQRRPYNLSLANARTMHRAFTASSSKLPTLETWHKRLGHANYRTVLGMAKYSVVNGMPFDLSFEPPACEPCVLGKQVRRHVPSIREGERATRKLERVYVDLTGPMSVTSRSGYLYSMNIIDDFSGYPWTVPLKSKADAFPQLCAWEL
jgi:GAG-pre-integrase domain